MSVWIDPPTWPAHGRLFSHVVSDVGYDELHAVAAAAGIPRRAFDGDHYDVAAERHADLVRAGAIETSGADLVRRLNASGLRLRKRKGDRGLARLFDQPTPFGRAVLDVVGSSRAHPSASAVALLQPHHGSWGVPWTLLDGRTPHEALTALTVGALAPSGHDDRHEVGWVRVTAINTDHTATVVQVYGGTNSFDTLPSPWNLYP